MLWLVQKLHTLLLLEQILRYANMFSKKTQGSSLTDPPLPWCMGDPWFMTWNDRWFLTQSFCRKTSWTSGQTMTIRKIMALCEISFFVWRKDFPEICWFVGTRSRIRICRWLCFIMGSKRITPRQFNMSPKNRQSQKETSLPIINSQLVGGFDPFETY